ncbi:MAG: OsmC family protein [Ferruginibacter sp.]
MIPKTAPHQYYFEVQLNWQRGHKGIITANDVKDTVKVATPSQFRGGVPEMWSPEHLFLGALCSCFMTTCFAIAEKNNVAITHFSCNAIGHVAEVGGHLEFVTADLYPKLFVEDEKDVAAANDVLLKTYHHSIVAKSVKTSLVNHGEVLVEKHVSKK